MSELRTTEIMVHTPMQEWNEEMVAQWNALAESVTRAVHQKRSLERDEELRRLQSALAVSEQRAVAAAHEAAEQFNAMHRHYEAQIATLRRELQHGTTVAEPEALPMDPPAARTGTPVNADRIAEFARGEWERDALSPLERAIDWLARQRSGPLFLPVTGFLSGLLIMVVVYPLLRHTPVRAANSSPAKALVGTSKPSAGAASPSKSLNPATGAAGSIKPASAPVNMDAAHAGKPQVPVDGAVVDKYAVLLAGGKTLTATRQGEPSAEYEARLAMHAGYARTAVYQKNGRYMVAVLFSSQDQARDGINAVNEPYSGRWKRTSSVVAVEQWCGDRKAEAPIVINAANVPVWSCGKGPG